MVCDDLSSQTFQIGSESVGYPLRSSRRESPPLHVCEHSHEKAERSCRRAMNRQVGMPRDSHKKSAGLRAAEMASRKSGCRLHRLKTKASEQQWRLRQVNRRSEYLRQKRLPVLSQ